MKNLDFNPLVSIVIPVYNGENYLAEAIDSALAQTYKNIEVIVVNDGSTDRTEKIIQSYGDKVRYFKKENGGVASALNLAIKKAKGEYISWLSHDDIYLSDKIFEQVEFLKELEDKNNSIIFTDYFIKSMFDKGRVLKSLVPQEFSTESFDKDYQRNCLLALFNSWINGCTLLIPKKALLKCKLFENDKLTTQDYYMWFTLLKHNYKFIYLKKKLFVTRHHTGQDTQKKLELHYRELNQLYIYAYDLFTNTFGKYSFKKMSAFLDTLRDRKLDSAYRHMLFSWANYEVKNNTLPKLWLYWESINSNIPDYIRLCWKSIVVKNKGDFEIICLDQYTIREYLKNLNLNYLLYEKSAHKADYIRFKLLERYGGFWLDSDFICFKSLLPLVKLTDTSDLWIGGYVDKSKKTSIPLIHFLSAKPNNVYLKKIINKIEYFLKKKLIIGCQPTWDELGSELITKLNVPYKLLSSKKYFSPIAVWDNQFSDLFNNEPISFSKSAYGQMLTSSGFDLYTKVGKMSERQLVKMKNKIGELWRLSLNLSHKNLTNFPSVQLTSKEKRILDKVYLFPLAGHILVRIYLRLKRIIGVYYE